jgi:hypothetical protein
MTSVIQMSFQNKTVGPPAVLFRNDRPTGHVAPKRCAGGPLSGSFSFSKITSSQVSILNYKSQASCTATTSSRRRVHSCNPGNPRFSFVPISPSVREPLAGTISGTLDGTLTLRTKAAQVERCQMFPRCTSKIHLRKKFQTGTLTLVFPAPLFHCHPRTYA